MRFEIFLNTAILGHALTRDLTSDDVYRMKCDINDEECTFIHVGESFLRKENVIAIVKLDEEATT